MEPEEVDLADAPSADTGMVRGQNYLSAYRAGAVAENRSDPFSGPLSRPGGGDGRGGEFHGVVARPACATFRRTGTVMVRETITSDLVAFRGAKGAAFAERKATLIDSPIVMETISED